MRKLISKARRRIKKRSFETEFASELIEFKEDTVDISEIPEKRRPCLENKPVFKVYELCAFLDIQIPPRYIKYQHHYVFETPLFNRIKRILKRENIILKLEIKKEKSHKFYTRFQNVANKFKDFYKNIPTLKQTDEELLKHYLRWWHLLEPRGFGAQNYFDYELYSKTVSEAQKFISRSDRIHIHRLCSIEEYRKYVYNKGLFNRTFSDYIHRDSLDMRKASYEGFCQFVDKHPRFFAKLVAGEKGEGSEIIEIADNHDILFERLKKERYILEELVIQHPDIAKLNPDTLNTIRIFTLLRIDNIPIIPYAGIRIGRKGYIVDNVSAGGLCAKINLTTGKIETEGVDMYRDRYAVHPDTNVAIKGFQIPHWEKVIETVKEASFVVPQVRYIGWDIAITAKGEVEIIEGNTKSGFRMIQFIDQIGKKSLYEKHIRDLEKANWKKAMNQELGKANSSFDSENKENDDFCYTIVEDSVTIDSYVGAETYVLIPNKIDGFPVKRIAEYAFYENNQIEEIEITDSVVSIGPQAFALCKNLHAIELPEKLKVISRGLFKDCVTIKKITLPKGIKKIYKEAFQGCLSLEHIELPREIIVLNADAFKNCVALKSVELPHSLERICKSAFEGCLSLELLYHFPREEIYINSELEKDIDAKSIGFPRFVDHIGKAAFKDCVSLTNIKIPCKIIMINDLVFAGCQKLEKVELNHQLKFIEKNAFTNCSSLTKIKLPMSIESITRCSFDLSILLICEKDSDAYYYAKKFNFNVLEQKTPSAAVLHSSPIQTIDTNKIIEVKRSN